MPHLKRKCGGLAAALVHGALVRTAGGMGIDGVRFPEGDIDVAAIRLPARLAGRKVLIRIGDTPVVLFAELVFGRIGIGIAAQPELLDEGIPLLVVAQVLEGLPFLIGNDVGHVLVQPGLVRAF